MFQVIHLIQKKKKKKVTLGGVMIGKLLVNLFQNFQTLADSVLQHLEV